MRFLGDVRLDSSHPDPAHRAGWTLAPSRFSAVMRGTAAGAEVVSARGVERRFADPLAGLEWVDRNRGGDGARWVGYLSYDLGRLFERLPARAVDDLGAPLFMFGRVEEEGGVRASSEVWRTGGTPVLRREETGGLRSTFSRPAYLAAVARAVEYIAAGDVFQVNLSQRFSVPVREPAAAVYERLRAGAPAWYGGLLDFGEVTLVSNSPELFLDVTPDGVVTTRPIKGTRPRAAGMEEELRRSEKDAAELNMIVDLERNDLGRVCEIGSVKVIEPRAIEAHPTVYHGAATVRGQLRRGVSFVELLRATFPGGSVTGAPKIRAMEIIDELEPVRRGPYCGAIGYLAADGSARFNVAIRTIVVKDGVAHAAVGGGVVADSTPVGEYDETLVKARAMFAALGVTSADD